MPPHVTINGRAEAVAGQDPTTTLLEFLRASGRTGTKEGCAEGDCGACTVAVAGDDGRYHAVNSCLLPLGSAVGRSFVTVEGVAPDRDELHPVQAALVEQGGSQCGYCTPGFVMSLFAAYYEGDASDAAIEGNLCRCTGYLPIRRAAERLPSPAAADPHLRFLRSARERAGDRGAAEAFDGGGTRFHAPARLEEALELIAVHEDAMPIAGGTDLGVDLTKFHRRFPRLVSLERIPELQTLVVDDPAELQIGAAVSLRRLEEEARGVLPALDEMLRWFAARQIRNRATLGGNLGTASPIGDLPPVLLAFDALVDLVSTRGRRTVGIADYFHGYRDTERRRDELIEAVRIPLELPEGSSVRHAQSYKVGKRGTDDISIVAACFRCDLDAGGAIRHARLAYGGVAAVPIRATDVEAWLVGRPFDDETARAAGRALHDAFTPLDDHRGSAAYRRRLAGSLFEKFVHDHRNAS